MGLVSMKEMLLRALDEKYAVGQFNVNNLEWAIAIIEEGNELNAPIILGVSEGAARYMGGFNTIVGFVKGYLKDHDIKIPIALHLDHGSTFENCKKAIDAGFTSVMIDASKHPLEENIRMTKQVVEYAHPRGVSVEAELGRVGGQEDDVVAETMYALPHECEQLVNETNVDCLTPALGSVHGPYKGEPKLGFDEMLVIRNLLKSIPLVLHGGSGIPDYQIKMAIERGTSKINVNTEAQQAWAKYVHQIIKDDENIYDPRKIIAPGLKGVRDVVRNKCEVFGCINKG